MKTIKRKQVVEVQTEFPRWQRLRYLKKMFRKNYIPDPLPVVMIRLESEYGLQWYGRGYRKRIVYTEK